MPGGERAPVTSILFVCTGNTCRSPLAETLAREEAHRRGLPVLVASAGTFAAPGAPPAEHAVEIARVWGADLRAHRARSLTVEVLERADVVVGMTPAHLTAVRDRVGGRRRSLLATDVLPNGHPWRGRAIPDPMGASRETYEQVAHLLSECVAALLDEIEGAERS